MNLSRHQYADFDANDIRPIPYLVALKWQVNGFERESSTKEK